jgi:Serine carboxypeptidase S28
LTPQFTWPIDTFGGRSVKKDFALHSNIIFTNGNLDPWQVGGVTTDINSNIYVKVLTGSAHHLDLRAPNPADPADVTAVRTKVTTLLTTWIENWRNQLQTSQNLSKE